MDVNYNVTYGNENELKCTGNINSENETGNESEKHEEESLKMTKQNYLKSEN